MYGNHIMGILIDAKETFASLDDTQIMGFVGKEREDFVSLGQGILDSVHLPEVEYIKAHISDRELEKHYITKMLKAIIGRDNWVQIFEGIPVGKSEIDIDNLPKAYIFLGVEAHNILIGLNKNKKEFMTWFAERMNTYGINIRPTDVVYYHLDNYID